MLRAPKENQGGSRYWQLTDISKPHPILINPSISARLFSILDELAL